MTPQRQSKKGSPYAGEPFLLPGRADGKSAECARPAVTVQTIQIIQIESETVIR